MKQIVDEYKKQIIYFLTNRKYIITVIFVAILSFGFTLTNPSIGVDDLCFDRYVNDTYILSANRWGTWLLYNILNIREFSPFWLDLICVTLMVIISIILSAFIKKQAGNKISLSAYVVFSSLIISNPLINQFFIYQSTNLAVIVSNLIVMICGIIIFENYFGENKSNIYIIFSFILLIPISMYESCAQTYIVFLFIAAFIQILKKEETNKKIFKYIILNIVLLVIAIILYFIIGSLLIQILDKFNILKENYARQTIMWISDSFVNLPIMEKLKLFNKIIVQSFLEDINYYFPIKVFAISSIICILIEFIKSINTKNVFRIITVLGIILSNFILIIIQLVSILYRTQFSFIITTAFLCMYIYTILKDKKILKYIINVIAILLIIWQTRMLNQYFYNDYKRYEREKNVANDIALNIVKQYDYESKPICFIKNKKTQDIFKINKDNGNYVIGWGVKAFEIKGFEIIKFINDLGYNFICATNEQSDEAIEKYNNLEQDQKEEAVIEIDNYIIVNLDFYNL